jgi:uncharacterized membrane protein
MEIALSGSRPSSEGVLTRIHHFLAGQSFYPLALSTLLGFAFFAGRVYLSRRLTFAFLSWNLFLAWIPYLASLLVVFLYQRGSLWRWLSVVPALVWLVFLPNAPYMVTDLLHLDERPPVPLWYDIGLMTTYVLSGLFLAFASLRAMQTLAQRVAGTLASWLFVLSAMMLSGFGIYLGRFMNFNSWDVLSQPEDIAIVIARRMIYPHSQTYGVTLMFGAILFVFYLAFLSAQGRVDFKSEAKR